MSAALLVPLRYSNQTREIIWSWTKEWWGVHFSGLHLHVGDDGGEPFGRGPSINAARDEARECCNPDTLVIADADTIIPPAQLRTTLNWLDEAPALQWVLPYFIYYNLSAERTQSTLEWPQTMPHVTAEPQDGEYIHRLTDSVSGIMVVRASFFDLVYGFDPGMRGWGYEDRVFQTKAETIIGRPVQRHSGYVLHLEHGATEAERFQSPECKQNFVIWKIYQRVANNLRGMDSLLRERAHTYEVT